MAYPSGVCIRTQIAFLQLTATQYHATASVKTDGCRLTILYVAGALRGWRIIETQERQRAHGTETLKRMHSFSTLEKLRTCLTERIAFRRAEAALLAREAVVRSDDLKVAQKRERLRERLCRTQPDDTRVLLMPVR